MPWRVRLSCISQLPHLLDLPFDLPSASSHRLREVSLTDGYTDLHSSTARVDASADFNSFSLRNGGKVTGWKRIKNVVKNWPPSNGYC